VAQPFPLGYACEAKRYWTNLRGENEGKEKLQTEGIHCVPCAREKKKKKKEDKNGSRHGSEGKASKKRKKKKE